MTMKAIGFCGWSGSGKTTVIEGVIAALKTAGQRVSVVKHAHHRFDIDHEGKDSWRHRQAGAFEVLVASNRRLALMREFESDTEPEVHSLLAQLSPDADWALVEGFRHADLAKIEVWRDGVGGAPLYPADPHVVAVATDRAQALPTATGLPVLPLNDPAAIAQWLMNTGSRHDYFRSAQA